MNKIQTAKSGSFRLFTLNKLPELFGKIGLYQDPLGDFTYTYKKDETREIREGIFKALEESEGLVSITMVCGEFKEFQIDLLHSLSQKKKDKCKIKMIGGPCYFPDKKNFNDLDKAKEEFESAKAKLKVIIKNENSSFYKAQKRKTYHFIFFEGVETSDGEILNYMYKEYPHGPTDRSLDTILIKNPHSNVAEDYLTKFDKSLFNTHKIKTDEDVESIILFDPNNEICK